MMSILERVRAHAKAMPDKAAISEGGCTLTYAELDTKTDAIASYFLSRGLSDAAVIGCVKTTMTTTLLVGIAALKSGHAFAILDARDSLERIRQVFATARCSMVMVDTEETAALLRPMGYQLHSLEEAIDTRESSDHFADHFDALSYIEPTSGSTGQPKLVPITQSTLNHYTSLQCGLGDISEHDIVALLGEMWFDTLLAGLYAGATLAAFDLRRRGSSTLPDWMREQKISVIQTFVAAFRALAEASDAGFPDLRLVKLAGEVVLRGDVESFERLCPSNAVLINYYGSTECSLVTAYEHIHSAPVPDGPGLPVGRPVQGTRVSVLAEDGSEMPLGATGRLLVHAKNMAEGYLNAPERSEGVYWRELDGSFTLSTGDLAQINASGDLVIVGRQDDQVKIRGYSVRYSYVEEVLSRRPDLSVVAVTSIVAPTGARQLVCHYVPAEDASPNKSELRAALGDTLPSYMVPSYFLAHRTLPRTDTGKVLRRALPNPLDMPNASARRGPTAKTETEAQVFAIWQEVLGHSNFSRLDDFFDIGGESLQAMAVVIRLERRFPVRIGYESLIMNGATIEAIAARIDASVVMNSAPRTLLLKEGGNKRPVYLMPVENGEFSDWLYMLNAAGDARDYIGVHVRDITERSHFPRTSLSDLGAYAADAIVAADPRGPYVLAGYSAGTQLAMETARALQDRRADVAGLILLDPIITRQEPLYRSWHIRRILSPLFKRGALLTTLNRAGHILLRRPAHELDVADETLFWTYDPQALKGIPIVLGRAIEDKKNPQDYLDYWQGILGRDIEVWDLPGYHNRITRDPFAAPLAARIETWLRTRLAEEDIHKKGTVSGNFEVAEPAVAS